MHCQLRRKPPNCPFPLELRHAAGRGPSHGHSEQAQKFNKDRACGSGDMLADRQTDIYIDTQTNTHRRAHYNTSLPLPRAKW